MIAWAADLESLIFAFVQHPLQGGIRYLKRDVQIEIVLRFEFKGLVRRFEERIGNVANQGVAGLRWIGGALST